MWRPYAFHDLTPQRRKRLIYSLSARDVVVGCRSFNLASATGAKHSIRVDRCLWELAAALWTLDHDNRAKQAIEAGPILVPIRLRQQPLVSAETSCEETRRLHEGCLAAALISQGIGDALARDDVLHRHDRPSDPEFADVLDRGEVDRIG